MCLKKVNYFHEICRPKAHWITVKKTQGKEEYEKCSLTLSRTHELEKTAKSRTFSIDFCDAKCLFGKDIFSYTYVSCGNCGDVVGRQHRSSLN